MATLQAELARQTARDPDSAGTVEAQAVVDKAVADRRVQVMQDAANSAAATWQGALKNANAVWVQDSEDSAKQVVALYQQTLNGLNENLADLMTGDKSHFAQMFKGIRKTHGGDSLKRIEAPLLGALGKADGSEANPFFVKMAGSGPMGSNSDLAAFGAHCLVGMHPCCPAFAWPVVTLTPQTMATVMTTALLRHRQDGRRSAGLSAYSPTCSRCSAAIAHSPVV